MSENFYLLEDTADAQEMVKTVKGLLESGEATNIKLALPVIQGGGLPEVLRPYIFVTYFFYEDAEIRELSYQILDTFFEDKAWEDIEAFKKPFYELEESDVCTKLEKIAALQGVDKVVVANLALKATGLGAKFCLEHQTDTIENILEEIIYHGKLSLRDFGLTELPKEIAIFKNSITILDISGNHFEALPDEIESLSKLSGLDFEGTPLNQEEITRLERVFTDIMCDKYFNEGVAEKQKGDNAKAVICLEKACTLKPDFAEAWQDLGAGYMAVNEQQKAEKALKQAMDIYNVRLAEYPKSAWSWFGKSIVHALLQNKEDALKALQEAIQIEPNYRYKAAIAEELKVYFEEDSFKQLLGVA